MLTCLLVVHTVLLIVHTAHISCVGQGRSPQQDESSAAFESPGKPTSPWPVLMQYAIAAEHSSKGMHAVRQDGVYTVGGSIDTPVSRSRVYHLLVDYPRLNQVFSSIDECHTQTEQQALQLLQVCSLHAACIAPAVKRAACVRRTPGC